MVTKGIITSIDFNGNTCQVRIPLFETAGNDPITGTAIVSNTPGSYNGYKVGDVVLVAFEDGKMQNPVIVGKLYLGAAKEKQDPRGTINVETTTASKSASLPADAVLTANVDSNVPNTNTPFGSLASIANNLNSLNTDVNQLDRFTRNQFNSVITDVNDQGEQLRSEIKQTAENIEANVVHTHKDGSQKGLGWDLNEKEWKINAKDTVVNGVVKDINIVTIDRSGMSIAGDLKLNGYPKNIIVRYAQNGSDTDYPYLYKFKQADFPDTEIDKTWYHDKYIKIIEADKEKYILISSENIDDYTITPGETVAYVYNLKETNPEWKTETPARVDGQYIWQWTHTESFSFNGDSWDEKDDDKVVCITGAQGEKGNTGIAITATKQWYILWPADSTRPDPIQNNKEPAEPETPSTLKKWMSTPPEAVNGHNVWTCYGSIFSDDPGSGLTNRHITYSTPVKDNAYALAQGKTTNYYSDTDPTGAYSVKKGDCWFKTISSTDDDYNNERPDQKQGKLYQCSGFDTDGKAIWKDIGGELIANKVTANYINALDITARKIQVNDDNGKTLFKANGIAGETDSNKVKIGGFDVDHNKLSIGTIGTDNSVALISDNSIKSVSIAKSSEKNDWRIVAGENFGVDSSGKTYMSDINIDGIEFNTSHSEPGKYFRIKVSAENVDNGVKFTAATLDGLLENNTDVNIKYFNSKGQQLSTTITILAGESGGSTIVKDAILDKFSWDPKYVDSTLGDFFNAYGYFNDKNKMHCAGYSFDLMPGGHGGNWDRAKSKTVSWYRTTWELINDSTMTKKLVALNNDRWVTNDDIVCHAIDKHEFTKIHSIIEQWNSTKQHGIVAKTYKLTRIIASGKASSDGLSVHHLKYYGSYTGDASTSISLFNPGITNDTTGKCSMTINGEIIKLEGPCWKSGTSASYESNLTGTSSKTGKSYNLRVSRLLLTDFGVGNVSGSLGSGNPKATLTETDNNTNLPDIETAKLITINPRFSLVHVDDSNEDVIYLYSKISNVPQIDIKNDTKQSASYIFMPLSSDPASTSIDLSESDFVKFSLEPEESAGARYFIFDDDKLNMFVYGKNYSSTWGRAQDKFEIKIEPSKKDENDILETVTIEEIYGLTHAPQEILDIDIDDHKINGLNWLSVHSYVENNEIKIVLANVSNANSEAVSINVIVNYTWQQEI